MDPSMYMMNQQQQYYMQQQMMQPQAHYINANMTNHVQENVKGKKPKGRMSSYTFFVQMCREEHRKKHPNENVNFTEFSKKCAERWKQMTEPEKKRFGEMADKDKMRYDKEMSSYNPPVEAGGRRKKKKKDPNAPKRPLSAFFLFCADERPNVKVLYPTYSVGETAKELGERWNKVPAELKSQYEAKVALDKTRYERDMENYKNKLARGDSLVDEVEEEEEEIEDDEE